MKSYLFLLFLVFIACDVEKNIDEIEDFAYEILKKIADILKECGIDNNDCTGEKMMDLYNELTFDQIMELQNFLISPECENVCVDAFTDVMKDVEEFCANKLCSYLKNY